MGVSSEQRRKAEALRGLHAGGSLLILPNVWNPIGARILEARGYPAVATASAAISASLGYRDGERIRRTTLLDLLERIARSVEVPVTADIETGYGDTLSELEETVAAVLATGVVGVNLEDGLKDGILRPVGEQCERIAATRECAAALGVHLVINARTDGFMLESSASVEETMDDAVSRAQAYAEAGADCIYPIGPGDEKTVRLLRKRIACPINILGSPTGASPAVLESIGVNRVSFGPFVFRALLRKFEEIADGLRDGKDASGMGDMLTREEAEGYLREGRE